MAVNRALPHLLILCEDDAVRQIVVGFLTDTRIDQRRVQVLRVAAGWARVPSSFQEEHTQNMRRFNHRHMLLLVDCDNREQRIHELLREIPEDLHDRVFIMGSLDEPESLARATSLSKETIGATLADECAEGKDILWSHEHVRHNQQEASRFREVVWPFVLR